jgi:hypothetical protein
MERTVTRKGVSVGSMVAEIVESMLDLTHAAAPYAGLADTMTEIDDSPWRPRHVILSRRPSRSRSASWRNWNLLDV